MNIIRKIARTILKECRDRGTYHTFLMYLSQVVGFLRAYVNTLIYYKNIESSIYSLQSNSRIEAFSKHARIYIGKFVFIRKIPALELTITVNFVSLTKCLLMIVVISIVYTVFQLES